MNVSVFKDTELTWRAKGIMGYLLSKNDGWRGQIYDIAKQSNGNENQVRTALRELKKFGYIKLEHPSYKGKFIGSHYIVSDEKFLI